MKHHAINTFNELSTNVLERICKRQANFLSTTLYEHLQNGLQYVCENALRTSCMNLAWTVPNRCQMLLKRSSGSSRTLAEHFIFARYNASDRHDITDKPSEFISQSRKIRINILSWRGPLIARFVSNDIDSLPLLFNLDLLRNLSFNWMEPPLRLSSSIFNRFSFILIPGSNLSPVFSDSLVNYVTGFSNWLQNTCLLVNQTNSCRGEILQY